MANDTTTIRYKLNGQNYDIPSNRAEQFEKQFPTATQRYVDGEDEYDISIGDRDRFKSLKPSAILLSERQAQATPAQRDSSVPAGAPIVNNKDEEISAVEVDTLKQDLASGEINTPGERVTEYDNFLNSGREIDSRLEKRYGELEKEFKPVVSGGLTPYVIPMELADRRANIVSTARRFIKDGDRIVNAAKENKGGMEGLGDSFTLENWDFGLTNIQKYGNLMVIFDKYNNGEELTQEEDAFLEAYTYAQAAEMMYGGKLSRGYKVGQSVGASIPFMLEFLINPASSGSNGAIRAATKAMSKKLAAKVVGKEAAGKLLKEGGVEALSKAVSKEVGEKMGKEAVKAFTKKGISSLGNVGEKALYAGAKLADDVLASSIMTGTTGAVGTIADSFKRKVGDVDFVETDDGLQFKGFVGGEDTYFGALAKAYGARTIENLSEMLGNYFAPIGRGLASGGEKFLKKIGLDKFNDLVKNVGTADWIKTLNHFLQETRWDGVTGEFGEELVGGVLNALTVGDQSIGEVFDVDNMIDTFLSVGAMGGFFSAIKTVGYRTPTQQVKNFVKAKEKALSDVFENGEGQSVIEGIEPLDDDGLKSYIRQVRNDESFTVEQRKAILDYIYAKEAERGMLMGKAKKHEEEPEAAEIDDIYESAKETTDPEAKRAAKLELDNAMADLTAEEMQALDDTATRDFQMEDHPEKAAQYNRYLKARAAMQGINDTYEELLAQEMDDSDRAIDEQTASDGMWTELENDDGQKFHVVSGNVEVNPDGTINRAYSDAKIIVADETGKKSMLTPKDFAKGRKEDAQLLKEVARRELADKYQSITDQEINTPTKQELADSIGVEEVFNTPAGPAEGVATNITADGNVIVRFNEPVSFDGVKQPKSVHVFSVPDFVAMRVPTVQPTAQQVEQKQAPEQITGDAEQAEEPTVEQAQDTQQTEQRAEVPQEKFETDYRGRKIPMKKGKDGADVVDQQAFFNKDAEAWAVWSDARRNDGGESTNRMLAAQISELEGKKKKLDKELSHTTDFDRQEEILDEMTALSNRIEELQDISDRREKRASIEAFNATQPETPQEYIAYQLSGFKGQVNEESLKKETGYKSETKDFRTLLAKKKGQTGLTLPQIAEMIKESDAEGFTAAMDDHEVLNEVIDILSQVGNYKELRDYVKNSKTARKQAEDNAAQAALEYEMQQAEGNVEKKQAAQKPVIDKPQNLDDIPKEWMDSSQQGNAAEVVDSIDEISDEDFKDYSRSIIVPNIPENVLAAIGAENKDVLIKRGVFAKNDISHKFTPEQSRAILSAALYAPNLVGSSQKITRPDYRVVIKTGEDRNPIVVLDVSNTKDNLEIVGWYSLDERNLERIKRQSIREGGELLILSPEPVPAASLSALPDVGLSESEDTDNSANFKISEQEIQKSTIQGLEDMTEEDVLTEASGHIEAQAADLGIGIVGMKVIGSRTAGAAREDSDLDILVEYSGDMKEDSVFNALNDEENRLAIAGINVDFFPIRKEESGSMESWLASHNNGIPVNEQETSEDMPSDITGAIEQARQEVNTEPTEGQKKAGNYKMGHIKLDGYDISIENPKGSVRKGVDENGKEWESEMKNDYGYIRGTEGPDGDHIDVFLSDTPEQGDVFVVDQVNPKTGEFDEHKVMYGFNSVEEAQAAYLANYEEGWQGLGNITPVSKEEFRKWVDSSHRKTKPFAEYASVKPLQDETGPFGPIFRQFVGKPKEAIDYLRKVKTGEAVGALSHKDVGEISIVYGDKKSGLAKIDSKHPEVVDNIQGILDEMEISQQSDNRIKLESDTHFAVISKDFLGNPRAPWLLTAFEKKNSVPDNTMDTGETPEGKRNDTATPQNTVSENKDSEISDFAKKEFENTKKSAGVYADRIEVASSSTGDETEENFIQSYNVDGKPSGVTRVDLIDSPADSNPTWFIIDGSDVDSPKEEQEKWQQKYDKYIAENPGTQSTDSLESGIAFRSFEEAMKFREWSEQAESVPETKESVPEQKPEKTEKFGQIKKKANKMAEKLNTPIVIHDDVSSVTEQDAIEAINNGEIVYGWFDVKDGSVHLYAPALNGAKGALKEVEKTVFHEVVGHHGLRKLLGEEKYNELLDRVWEAMSQEEKDSWMNGDYLQYFKGSEQEKQRAAADEKIAQIAENVDYEKEKTVWDIILDKIKELFGKLESTDVEIVDALRASYRMLAQSKFENTVAEDIEKTEVDNAAAFVERGEDKREANPQVVISHAKEKYDDFGEKIGMARKDTAKRGFKRGVGGDSVPTWRKKYKVANIRPMTDAEKRVASATFGSRYNVDFVPEDGVEFKDGKPFIGFYEETVKSRYFGDRVRRHYIKDENGIPIKFNSMEQFEATVPVFEAKLQKFYVTSEAGKYKIVRRASNGKSVEYAVFDSEEEARTYIASPEGCTSLLNHKRENFELPALEELTRNNAKDWRKGKDVTPDDFLEMFGFRGGEFGNWLNADERQQFLNYAYDALMDLSAIIGVSPRALSLNGELSIAFGARGVQGAKAHYEPKRAVINLTKMNGAGSLAHEWAHALDNYFGLLTMKKTRDREATGAENDWYITEDKTYGIGARKEVRDAFNEIMSAIKRKEVTRAIEIGKSQEEYDNLVEHVDKAYKGYRDRLERGITKWVYNRKTKQREQQKIELGEGKLQEIDALVEQLKSDATYSFWYDSKKSGFRGEGDVATKIYELIAPVMRNRAETYGPMHDVFYWAEKLKRAGERLEKAKNGETETVKTKTRLLEQSEWFDKGRASSYFAKDVELFARSFETYVMDKMRKQGVTSDYLTYDKGSLYDEMWLRNPYPSGEELAAISEKFDKLFATVQESKDDKGNVALFRKYITEIKSGAERKYRKSGAFSFTGKEKVRTIDDVAFIFKELENSATENSFIVFIKDQKPTVLHVGMGNMASTIFDTDQVVTGYNDFQPDEIYMVHNHPSGNISPSNADIKVFELITKQYPDVYCSAIIIDTKSGKYGVFDKDSKISFNMKEADGETVEIPVLSFDRMVFDKDFKADEFGPVNDQYKVAAFLSAYRLGEGNKMGALMLNKGLVVNGNLVTDASRLDGANAEEMAEQIADACVRCNAGGVILFGNFKYSSDGLKKFRDRMNSVSAEKLSLYDGVTVQDGKVYSLLDGTFLADNNTRFRKGSANVDEEYLAAVEAGDMEKAQRMVDEAAERAFVNSKVRGEDGKLIKVYHGTMQLFNVFDMEQADSANEFGKGMYFTDAKSLADRYASVENNPDYSNEHLVLERFEELGRQMGLDLGYEDTFNNDYIGLYNQAYDDIAKKGRVIAAYLNIENPYVQTEAERADGEPWADYDGVIDMGFEKRHEILEGNQYVVYDANQIKSAEPVTYDDSGNVIPLSERFSTGSDDIRFRRANMTQNGFISNAAAAVERIKMEKATPAQWKAMITKEGGLKAAEDKWLGLSDWLDELKAKTLTKDEVMNFINENAIQIEETKYDESASIISLDIAKLMADQKGLEFRDKFYDAFDVSYYEGDEAFGNEGERYEAGVNDEELAVELYNENHPNAEITSYDKLGDVESWANEVIKSLLVNSVDTKSINGTRLGYTTDGLDNKREIALTVPTIEPWNESDEIHFGDAGEGRAIAWIRFGDTSLYPKNIEELRNAAYTELNEYKRSLGINGMMSYSERVAAENNLTDEQLSKIRELEDKANDKFVGTKPTERVLFIDEIQSKRHQEGREKGYSESLDNATVGEFYEEAKYGYDMADVTTRNGKVIAHIYKTKDGKYYGESLDGSQMTSDRDTISEVIKGLKSFAGFNGIPTAPFEKNWHELAMKRMLRLAAEEGFDKVAWTTGETQAERYNIGNLIDFLYVDKRPNEDNRFVMVKPLYGNFFEYGFNEDGVITYNSVEGEDGEGKTLGEVFGKDVAIEIMSSENGDNINLRGSKRIGGEGMRGFYDDILPRFVNKYGKKWGVKVEDVELDDIDQVAHSVAVTPEMRQSVIEGQLMFRKADPANLGDVLTAEYPFKELRRQWIEDGEIYNSSEAYDILQQLLEDYPDFRPAFERFIEMNEQNKETFWETGGRDVEFEEEQLQDAFNAALDEEILNAVNPNFDGGVLFRIREKEAPKQTGIGYKVFVLKNGRLYPPMVANPGGESTPVGIWLDADAAPISGQSKTGRPQVKAGGKGTQGGGGQLAYRPGWHLGEIPYAIQFNRVDENGEKTLFPKDFVWAEVEYAADKNYQQEAEAEGMTENGKYRHSYAGLKEVPEDGFYTYRTNPNPETGPWIITGAMRVNKILTPSEVDELVKAAGREPQQREADSITDEQVDALNAQFVDDIDDGTILFSKKPTESDKAIASITGRTPEEVADERVETVRTMRRNLGDIMDRYGKLARVAFLDERGHGSGSYYDGLIKIYAVPRNEDYYDLEDSYFHENFHAYMDNGEDYDIDFFNEIIEASKKDAQRIGEVEEFGKFVSEIFNDKEYKAYKEEEVASRIISGLMVEGNVPGLLSSLSEESRIKVNDFLNKLYYEPRQERERRAHLRLSRGSKSADRENAEIPVRGSAEDEARTILYRKGGDYTGLALRDRYNSILGESAYKIRESHQDSMLSLKVFQEELVKESGLSIESYEDAYTAENHLSSINSAEIEHFFNNELSQVGAALADMNKAGVDTDDCRIYAISKHGLERNEVFARRDAKREMAKQWEDYYKKYSGQSEADVDADKRDEERLALIEAENALYEKYRQKDYSGLTSLFLEEGEKEISVAEAEKRAEAFIDEIEGKAGKQCVTLWTKINNATKKSLYRTYKGGLMTRSEYERVRDMFHFYIPLRGFDDTMAEDVYEYMSPSSPFSPSLTTTAKGRKTVAFDPFGTIGNMFDSSVHQANRNRMKERFLNFVLNRPNDLVTVMNIWYEYDEVNGEWRQAAPEFKGDKTPEQISEAYEAFENRMRGLAAQGKAMQKKPQEGGVNIPYRILPKQEKEHYVTVTSGGKEYILVVNGNPRLAQALNGMTNPDADETLQRLQRFNRWLAANFTTRSPKFVLRNMTRDTIFALFAIDVKEDREYNRAFRGNLVKNYGRIWQLMTDLQSGKLDDMDEADMSEAQRYFKEFIMNGGETGYSQIRRADEYKKMVEKMINDFGGDGSNENLHVLKEGWRAVDSMVGFANRCVEDICRFSVYMTSRQMGRDIDTSVSNAKEVSVNFNKKGSGKGNGAGIARVFYLFYNAGVQGLENFSSLRGKSRKHWTGLKKFDVRVAETLALGALIPVINSIISSAVGGDDDEYCDLPDWIRRNNLCLGGGGFYITIPLPIELRAIYGIGDIAYMTAVGRMKDHTPAQIALEVMGQIADILPLNPVEGAVTNKGKDFWSGVVLSVAPDLVAPLLQLAMNTDFTGKPIWKDNSGNKNRPEWTKAYAGTSKVLVSSTKFLNAITGGDEYEPGAININPAAIEHILEGYLGGMMQFANESAKTVRMTWDEDVRKLRNVPLVNVFTQYNDNKTASSYVNDMYYHYKKESETTLARLRGVTNEGDIMRAADVLSSPEYKRAEYFKNESKKLKKYQDQLEEAEGTPAEEVYQRKVKEQKEKMVEWLTEND